MDPQRPDLPGKHQAITPSLQSEMESSSLPEDVQLITDKMEHTLNDLKYLSNLITKRSGPLSDLVQKQKTIQDVKSNMDRFNNLFKVVSDSLNANKQAFDSVTDLILSDFASVENKSNSPFKVTELANCKIQKLDQTQKVIEPILEDVNCKIPSTEDETVKSRPIEVSKNSHCRKDDSETCLSDSEKKLPSTLPNSYDTINSYDSSNDLPEAKAHVLAVSKQMPDSSNMNDLNTCEESPPPNNASQTDDDEPDETKSQDNEPDFVSSTHPESGRETNHAVNESRLSPKSSQKNLEGLFDSQISESLLLNSSPALLEKLQKENPTQDDAVIENLQTETHRAEPENCEENVNSEKNEKTLNDISRLENEPNISRKSSRIDSSSKKVNDWLEQQESQPNILPIENMSDIEMEKSISETENNGEEQTEIFDSTQPSRDSKNEHSISCSAFPANSDNIDKANSDDDNNSLPASIVSGASASTTVLPGGKDSKSRSKVHKALSNCNEIIELSDDDASNKSVAELNGKDENSVSSDVVKKYKNNPNITITPVKEKYAVEKEEGIEVVELEDQGDQDSDDICVIECSQGSARLTPSKSPCKTPHNISDSSECDSDRVQGSGTRNNFKSASQKTSVNSENDEAKRKLLEGSSSSNSSLNSGQSDSNMDSDSTVILKRKKMKKKRRKRNSDESSHNSEEKSVDSEDEVKRLLNLNCLRKRKIVQEASGTESENNSSGSVKVRSKKKRRKKNVEDEPTPFSDADSICSEQKSEDVEDPAHDISPSSRYENNDTNEFCKELLLNSVTSGSESETSSVIGKVGGNKKKKSGVETDGKNSEENSDASSFLEEDSGKKKKKRKYDPLLHGNFSLSSPDSSSEKEEINPSQKSRLDEKRYQKIIEKKRKAEEERCSTQEDVNDSSSDDKSMQLNLDGSESDEEEHHSIKFVSCDPECVEISEDDISEFEDDGAKKDCAPQSSHQMSPSEDEIELSQESLVTGRKNIKKIISSKALTQETKIATKEEEERRRRISEKEKVLSQTCSVSKVGKLVLDFDEDTKEALVTVHPLLMEVLKEHQIAGLKFMWNTCFESIKQTIATKGSGCVLAHCMGLGKSLQVVALVHTIINHPSLNMKTILITCPKSVVLNWSDEFQKWLRQIERTDVDSRRVKVFNLLDFKDIIMREKGLKDWHENGGVMIMSYSSFRSLVLGQKGKENKQKPEERSATNDGEAAQSFRSAEDSATNAVYEKIRNYLIEPGPDVIVCDEGHTLKNDVSGIHKAVDQVRTRRRIVLTGTPMQNNLLEYYYMVNLVKPNYLGDKKEFRNRFYNPIDNGQYVDSTPQDVKIMKSRAHVLYKKLDGIVNRCDVNMFKDQVPPRYEYVLKLRLTDLQIKLYEAYISEVKGMDESTEGTAGGESQADNGKLLLKSDAILSNIVNHPLTLTFGDGGTVSGGREEVGSDWKKCLKGVDLEDKNLSPKTLLFFEILEKCQEQGDKLLVFSQHLKFLDLIEHFLGKIDSKFEFFNPNASKEGKMWVKGKDYFRLDGKTSTVDRKKYIEIFNNPKNKRSRLFLLSSKAGGVGVNLTGANRAIVFDVSWNPSVDSQSVFRIYRFGQLKPCYIYRFVAKGTMEEKKYNRQVSKLSTSSRVVDNWQVNRHYKEGYLKALYNYDFKYDAEPRQTLKVPADKALAEMLKIPNCIDTYDETDVLLQNIVGEELDEEERRKAWEDYENEKDQPPPLPSASAAPPPRLPNLMTAAEQLEKLKRQYLERLRYPSSSSVNNGGRNTIQSDGPSNSKHKITSQPSGPEVIDKLNKIDYVQDLLNRNIIPLGYEPLTPSQPSSSSVSAKAPENKTNSDASISIENSNEPSVNLISGNTNFNGKIDQNEAQKENLQPQVSAEKDIYKQPCADQSATSKLIGKPAGLNPKKTPLNAPSPRTIIKEGQQTSKGPQEIIGGSKEMKEKEYNPSVSNPPVIPSVGNKKTNAKPSPTNESMHKFNLLQYGTVIDRLPQSTSSAPNHAPQAHSVTPSTNSTIGKAGFTPSNPISTNPTKTQATKASPSFFKTNRKPNIASRPPSTFTSTSKASSVLNPNLTPRPSSRFTSVSQPSNTPKTPNPNITPHPSSRLTSASQASNTPKNNPAANQVRRPQPKNEPPIPPQFRHIGPASQLRDSPFTLNFANETSRVPSNAPKTRPSGNQAARPPSNSMPKVIRQANQTARETPSSSSANATNSTPTNAVNDKVNLKDILEDLQNYQKIIKDRKA